MLSSLVSEVNILRFEWLLRAFQSRSSAKRYWRSWWPRILGIGFVSRCRVWVLRAGTGQQRASRASWRQDHSRYKDSKSHHWEIWALLRILVPRAHWSCQDWVSRSVGRSRESQGCIRPTYLWVEMGRPQPHLFHRLCILELFQFSVPSSIIGHPDPWSRGIDARKWREMENVGSCAPQRIPNTHKSPEIRLWCWIPATTHTLSRGCDEARPSGMAYLLQSCCLWQVCVSNSTSCERNCPG